MHEDSWLESAYEDRFSNPLDYEEIDEIGGWCVFCENPVYDCECE